MLHHFQHFKNYKIVTLQFRLETWNSVAKEIVFTLNDNRHVLTFWLIPYKPLIHYAILSDTKDKISWENYS